MNGIQVRKSIRRKKTLYFSKNKSREEQNQVKQRFGVEIVKHHQKYLGLPPLVGRRKRKAFNWIKD